MKPNLIFDRVEWQHDLFGRSVDTRWYKDDVLVHSLHHVWNIEQNQPCPACWEWRAEIVPMTQRRTVQRNGEDYTYSQCPECKGLLVPRGRCTCGEGPHRVSCPMGFLLYFGGVEVLG